jgi:uncharacterized membrane protein
MCDQPLDRNRSRAARASHEYGGTVLKTSLSQDHEKELQEALHGAPAGTQ